MVDISESYASIFTSTVRLTILKALVDGPKRPAMIAQETGIKQPNVSVQLRKLQKKGLVKCLTPDKKAWRVFAITESGKEALDQFKTHSFATGKPRFAAADKKRK